MSQWLRIAAAALPKCRWGMFRMSVVDPVRTSLWGSFARLRIPVPGDHAIMQRKPRAVQRRLKKGEDLAQLYRTIVSQCASQSIRGCEAGIIDCGQSEESRFATGSLAPNKLRPNAIALHLEVFRTRFDSKGGDTFLAGRFVRWNVRVRYCENRISPNTSAVPAPTTIAPSQPPPSQPNTIKSAQPTAIPI